VASYEARSDRGPSSRQARERAPRNETDGCQRFAVEARVPKGSQLVVLESTARAEDGAAYRQIQEQAVQADFLFGR
jgi:hypothetical protein